MSRIKDWMLEQPDTSKDDAACVMQQPEWQAEYERWLDQIKENTDDQLPRIE